MLILVGYSIYFICRSTPKTVWLFVLTLIGVTPLALALPDLILGGYRSGIGRYVIPCYIGIQLAIAYLLATQITSVNSRHQKLWQLFMSILLTGGILSCVISSQAQFWWNKSTASFDSLQVVHIINQTTHPLLLINTSPVDVISLSYLLEPKVRLKWWLKQTALPIKNNVFSDIFFVGNNFNSGQVKDFFQEHNYKIKLIYNGRDKWLWKLNRA